MIMVRATLRLQVRPGREKEFEKVWQDVAVVAGQAPGNLSQALLRDARDPAWYVITSDWADEDSFHDFERSPEQDELTAPIRALRQSASMELYDLVSTAGPVPASGTMQIQRTR
jgi:heme-degrading monooxygenase HmoA